MRIFEQFRNWRERRTVARHPVLDPDWRHALARCAPGQRLGASDQARLRVLATLFLARKALEPVQGLELTVADRALLATHASVPILKLGIEWYNGWHSVIVYPGAFIVRHQHTDAAGVVHPRTDVRSGEAWGRGPVIVSWADVLQASQIPGRNVVIHEMAHKLDMLNGDANGFPPLERRADQRAWSRTFTAAWDHLQALHAAGAALPIDPYALENPAEFFAVVSEQFFEQPTALRADLPEVYRQLAKFYRQHPA